MVQLDPVCVDPALVPRRQRCQDWESLRKWPTYRTEATALGRIRIALIDEFGADCHACHQQPGAFIDHDHFTGAVRGLLCRFCNGGIDHCPHRSGCPWADYLNQPPADALELRYPRRTRLNWTDQRTIDYLGFNPIY